MGRLSSLKPRVGGIGARVKTATIAETVRTRGSAWMAIRARILSRDCGLCVHCSKAGRVTRAEQVDHITPLEQGGTDADDNLQSLCEPCHEAKSKGEARIRWGGGG